MVLVRIARQSELGPGQQLLKESHDKKILLVRHNNSVFATDAHCWHHGHSLQTGLVLDIEDVAHGTHKCVIQCPAHKMLICLSSGVKVDQMLGGNVCSSKDQKQRVYSVHMDSEFIFVDIPEIQLPLPSDLYNQTASAFSSQHHFNHHLTPPHPHPTTQGFGLMGPSLSAPLPPPQQQQQQQQFTATNNNEAPPPTPLQPYAGFASRPLVSENGEKADFYNSADNPPLQFSQESITSSQTQEHPASPMQLSAPPPKIQFPASKNGGSGSGPVPAHIARRKAATAAILKRSYVPPTAPLVDALPPPPQKLVKKTSAQKTLFETWGIQNQQQQQHQASPVAVGGNDAMDMS
jgi:nitrite reductase/ring-hydroxylating ferredoxin subunit